MDLFAKALLFMLPAFFLMIIIEATYAKTTGRFNFRSMDVISSLSAGMTNAIKSVLGLTVIILGYKELHGYFAVFEIKMQWWTYLMAFVLLDFATYWYHRLAHSINVFWVRHVIHHSGEDFNTATALRQSISKFLNISVFFLIPAAIIGVPPKIIALVTPIHLFVQVWYHTEHIGKLGWLEYIIVTPSQHRVHHAINEVYIDKNLSPVFCIWDRFFGTFQEELDEEPCVYGVTRQVNTWNPILINLDHLWLLLQDAWRTDRWWDKMRIWFMPTGWRPDDVKEKFPIESTSSHDQKKYTNTASDQLKMWSWLQLLFLITMVFHLLYKLPDIGVPDLFLYGGFMFVSVFSYTTLMDMKKYAFWIELVKVTGAIAVVVISGDWFLLNSIVEWGSWFVLAFQVASVGIVGWFVKYELS